MISYIDLIEQAHRIKDVDQMNACCILPQGEEYVISDLYSHLQKALKKIN